MGMLLCSDWLKLDTKGELMVCDWLRDKQLSVDTGNLIGAGFGPPKPEI